MSKIETRGSAGYSIERTASKKEAVVTRGGSTNAYLAANDGIDDQLIATDYADATLRRSDLEQYAETLKMRIRQNSPRKEDLEVCLTLCEASLEERHMEAKRTEMMVRRSAAPGIVPSVGDSESMLAKRASLSKAILAAAQGRQLTGAEAELDREGRSQHPHSGASIQLPTWYTRATGNFGQDASQAQIAAAVTGQQTLADRIREARHAEPTAVSLGAVEIDASGSSSYLVPFFGRTAAASANEGDAVSSIADFQQTTLTPQRFSRRLSISQLGLSVGAGGMDQIIANDLNAAHRAAVDKVAFDAVRADATYMKNAVDGSGDYPATTLADLFALVEDYMIAAQSNELPTMVCSPEAFEDLNTIENTNLDQTLAQAFTQATGVNLRPIVNMVDGTFTIQTIATGGTDDQVVTGAGLLVAADFSDVVIANFGGPAIIVDPYTAASQDIVTFVSNQYVDAGLIRSSVQAYATASSALTPA
jgi:hypothetical protein